MSWMKNPFSMICSLVPKIIDLKQRSDVKHTNGFLRLASNQELDVYWRYWLDKHEFLPKHPYFCWPCAWIPICFVKTDLAFFAFEHKGKLSYLSKGHRVYRSCQDQARLKKSWKKRVAFREVLNFVSNDKNIVKHHIMSDLRLQSHETRMQKKWVAILKHWNVKKGWQEVFFVSTRKKRLCIFILFSFAKIND